MICQQTKGKGSSMRLSNKSSAAFVGILLAVALCNAEAQQAAGNASSKDAAATGEGFSAAASADSASGTVGTIAVNTLPSKDAPAPAEKVVLTQPAQLQEVVVTATKRASPVRKIAGTVNVLAGKDLEREGVQNIEQIVSRVPGVNLTDEGTGGTIKRITIRGISAGLGVNPTAGTLFNDIPFSDPFIPKVQLDPNPFDMATVEVLKGPQGTLFGGTGLNGLIRYVPEAPQLDEVHLKYYTQLQSYPGNGGSGWNYGAVLNAPFADHQAAIRLVGFRRDSPGYTDDTATGKKDVNSLKQYGFRGALTWLPAEHWKVGLLATTQHTRENDLSYTTNYNGDLEHGDAARPSPAKYSYSLGSFNVDREFDWATLTSQTSYFEKKFNIFLDASRAVHDANGMLPLLAGADDNHSKGITQEFRLVSAPSKSPWKWLAGVFYYKLHLYDCASVGALQGLPTLPIPIPGLLTGVVANPCPGNVSEIGDQLVIGQLIGDVDVQEKALFGELTRKLGDHWEATLGGRVYRIQSGGTVTTEGALYSTANQGQSVARDADVSEQGFSPKASIVFAPTKNFRSYFTASRGFRFGGPQIAASTPTTSVPPFYKSDSLWNYEVGLRTDWFDRTLRIDASAYHIDWKNPQVYQITADRQVNFIDNVGGAKGDGVDLSLRYLFPFLRGLSFETSVAWNRTVSTEDFNSSTGVVVPAGSPWPLAPRWQGSTTLGYTLPIDAWQAGASIREAFLSHACNTIECGARVFGYRTWDLNVFASGPEGSYWPQISVSLSNLTDERGYSNITTNPSPASDTITYIAPRALVLRLSGSF